MGMITRVRARLQSINTLTKIDPRIQDEKTAQTGEDITTVRCHINLYLARRTSGGRFPRTVTTIRLAKSLTLILWAVCYQRIMNNPSVTCNFIRKNSIDNVPTKVIYNLCLTS